MLCETGIVLFLASVVIKAGEKFILALASGNEFIRIAYGAIITLVPIMIVGLITRIVFNRNYFEVCGLLAGSMTDPPALMITIEWFEAGRPPHSANNRITTIRPID